MSKNYQELENIFYKAGLINSSLAILDWDTNVMMPLNSANARSEVVSYLTTLHHSMVTNPTVSELISYAANDNTLSDWQKANLREITHTHNHNISVPSELVTELSKQSLKCEVKWREARAKDDFSIVQQNLQQLFKINREIAKAKAEFFKTTPYEALLDSYDPGRKVSQLDMIFGNLKTFLLPFIDKVTAKQKSLSNLNLAMTPDKQKEIGVGYAKMFGLDFDKARMDTSTHPFCGGIPDDIRITTRYDSRDFTSGIFGVLHETGHALYEQHLPSQWRNLPVGRARSFTIHESQSLFVEMQISMSLAFINQLCANHLHNIEPLKLWEYVNHVEKSFIRVDADEVTYPLHVILRYEIEKQIINGQVEAKDLPEVWNQTFKELFGFPPPNNSMGCLQDIHWYMGELGYFPCYTLGAVTAAQLMKTIKRSLNIDELITQSNFLPIIEWLKSNIHSHGCLYTPSELLIKATGEDLNEKYFIEYISNKFGG